MRMNSILKKLCSRLSRPEFATLVGNMHGMATWRICPKWQPGDGERAQWLHVDEEYARNGHAWMGNVPGMATQGWGICHQWPHLAWAGFTFCDRFDRFDFAADTIDYRLACWGGRACFWACGPFEPPVQSAEPSSTPKLRKPLDLFELLNVF